VVVFSGAAREEIRDAGFATGDTDITFGKRTGQFHRSAGDLLNKARTALRPPADPVILHPQTMGRAVGYSIVAIVFANIVMLWASGVFGWAVFRRTWPMELVTASVLLAAIMSVLANPWLLIPIGILLGNGFLFVYFSLTGLWSQWTLLWPLEPILIGVSIVSPFLLQNQGDRGRWLARRLGVVFIILAAILFIFSLIAGTILTI
jgi:hypothetical protein